MKLRSCQLEDLRLQSASSTQITYIFICFIPLGEPKIEQKMTVLDDQGMCQQSSYYAPQNKCQGKADTTGTGSETDSERPTNENGEDESNSAEELSNNDLEDVEGTEPASVQDEIATMEGDFR